MTPNEYQAKALRTEPGTPGADRQRTEWHERITNAALGCTGEAGEFADLVKKWRYMGHPLDPNEVMKELGDQLWYICLAADSLGRTLEDVMRDNLRKLAERYPDGFSPEASINRKD